VIVCPYRDATQSGVVLTAYAFGVPVVVSAVGGLIEYVEHGRTGLVVPPGDANALAAAVGQLLLDPILQARIRDGIHDAVRGELNWNRTAESLLRTYSECRLQGPPRRRN
jgi:glycosyltransferase involved in cell wall biosynthesis